VGVSAATVDCVDDVFGDAFDLGVLERVTEGRHSRATVSHLILHGREILRRRDLRQVGAAVTARPVDAVATRAVRVEDRGARGVAGLLGALFACVLTLLAATRSRHLVERAVEPEQPQVVAMGATDERVSGCVEGDVFLAVVLEDRGGGVRAGAGLEAPQNLAGSCVVRLAPGLLWPSPAPVSRSSRSPYRLSRGG